MPKLVISVDGVVVKQAQLTKDRTTLGRRPYNDIVIDHLAISGEHAVILMHDGEVVLQDAQSTNGTYVNGARISSRKLVDGDRIEMGRYRIDYYVKDASRTLSPSLKEPPPVQPPPVQPPPRHHAGPDTISAGAATTAFAATGFQDSRPAAAPQKANPRVRVLNGSATGRELLLLKETTTIGKPGVSVASIHRKEQGFELALVEGAYVPTVNGVALDNGPIMLRNHDRIELAGIRMEFIES